MTQHKRHEQGIAMVVSIVAIVVIGAMVIGVGSAVVLEHRQAQMSGQVSQGFAVAELGLNDAIADWDASAASALAVNDSMAFTGAAPGGAGSYSGWIRRMSVQTYLVEVTGTSQHGGARERLGAFVKSDWVEIDVRAAARGGGGGGQAQIKTGATVSGRDMVPVGWGPRCSGPLQDIPGAEWKDDALVTEEPGSTLEGAPPLVEDPSITPGNLFEWGGLDYDDLVALATIVVPNADVNANEIWPRETAGGDCDVTQWRNWGAPEDPSNPCVDYFPIIHRPGQLTIKDLGDGAGQGILLVDGQLTIEDDFHFYGIVLVKGEIQLKGDVEIYGAVIVGGQLQMEADDHIQYSQCVANRAQSGGLIDAARLRSRAWFHL